MTLPPRLCRQLRPRQPGGVSLLAVRADDVQHWAVHTAYKITSFITPGWYALPSDVQPEWLLRLVDLTIIYEVKRGRLGPDNKLTTQGRRGWPQSLQSRQRRRPRSRTTTVTVGRASITPHAAHTFAHQRVNSPCSATSSRPLTSARALLRSALQQRTVE